MYTRPRGIRQVLHIVLAKYAGLDTLFYNGVDQYEGLPAGLKQLRVLGMRLQNRTKHELEQCFVLKSKIDIGVTCGTKFVEGRTRRCLLSSYHRRGQIDVTASCQGGQ